MPPSSRMFWYFFIAVLVMALVLRIGAAYQWQSNQASPESFAWGDSKTYWQIAENLVSDGDYRFGTPPKRIFRSPGYCGFLAIEMMASQKLLGQNLTVLTARFSGCVLGVLAIAALSLWIRDRTGDERLALLTALGTALYPGGIAMSVFVLAEALFMPVAVSALWTWDRALSADSKSTLVSWSAISGLLSGQAVLIRPSWLLFPPFLATILLLFYGRKTQHFASALTVGLMMAVAMSPWWYRNYQLTGRWIPTTLQVGASLYDGWNPHADGSSDMTYGYQIEEQVRVNLETSVEATSWSADQLAIQQELSSSDALGAAAKKWAAENPATLLKLFFIKVYRTWRPWPVAAEAGSWKTQVLVGTYFILVVIFAIPNLYLLRQSATWLLVILPTLYFTILHGVFVGSVRYRQPAVFLLMPLAAYGVLNLLLYMRRTSAGNLVEQ